MSALEELEVRLAGRGHGGGHAAQENRDKRGRFAPGKLDAAGESRFVSHETGAESSPRGARSSGGLPKRGDTIHHGGTEHTVTGTRKSGDGHDVYTTSGHKIHVKEGQDVGQGTKTGGGKSKELSGAAAGTRARGEARNLTTSSQSGRSKASTATEEQRLRAQESRNAAAGNRTGRALTRGDTGETIKPGDTVKAGAQTLKVKSVQRVSNGHNVVLEGGHALHIPTGRTLANSVHRTSVRNKR